MYSSCGGSMVCGKHMMNFVFQKMKVKEFSQWTQMASMGCFRWSLSYHKIHHNVFCTQNCLCTTLGTLHTQNMFLYICNMARVFAGENVLFHHLYSQLGLQRQCSRQVGRQQLSGQYGSQSSSTVIKFGLYFTNPLPEETVQKLLSLQ